MRTALIALIIISWASFIDAQTVFVNETRQDLDVAINNYSERVKSGPEVSTIQGMQITPGSVPRDFRINQQMYDDITIVSGHIINLMRMVFMLKEQPTIIDNIQVAMNQLHQVLTNLGIRYNLDENLSSIHTELRAIMLQLRAIVGQNTDVNTLLMVPYNRLDVIRAEIENLLKTKIVTT